MFQTPPIKSRRFVKHLGLTTQLLTLSRPIRTKSSDEDFFRHTFRAS